MTSVSDLLSAQSLLLTAITALTALWSDQLDAAREERPKGQRYEDNTKAHQRLRRVLWWRASPLLGYAGALATVLIPPSVQLLGSIWHYWFGQREGLTFDPLAASLLLVHAGLILLTIHLAIVWWDIFARHKSFEQLAKA